MGAIIRDELSHMLDPYPVQGVHQGGIDRPGPEEGCQPRIFLGEGIGALREGVVVDVASFSQVYPMLPHNAELSEAGIKPCLLICRFFNSCVAPAGAALQVEEGRRD